MIFKIIDILWRDEITLEYQFFAVVNLEISINIDRWQPWDVVNVTLRSVALEHLSGKSLT